MNSAPSLAQRLLRQKPIETFVAQLQSHHHGAELKRSITLFQLTMFGVGATIGTGIFFVLAEQVPVAGPAVLFAFLIAGFAAGLTALCYAEMSSMIPVSGSSYSYAYATLGEGLAFFVAACLVMEYGVSAGAVAVGWSEYLHNLLLITTGYELPRALLVDVLPPDWLERLLRLDCIALDTNYRELSADIVASAHAAGFRVLCYTPNDPERVEQLLSWGTDSIITDAVDRIPPRA